MTILARLGNHPRSLASDMRSRWRTLLVVGVVLLLLGLFGLYASTLLARTMTLAIAGLLVLAGVLQLSQSLLLHGLPSFAMTVALGAAQVAGGVAIWTHPEWAALAVAVTVAGVLLVQAIAHGLLALRLDRQRRALGVARRRPGGVAGGDRVLGRRALGRSHRAVVEHGHCPARDGVAYVGIALLHRRRRTHSQATSAR